MSAPSSPSDSAGPPEGSAASDAVDRPSRASGPSRATGRRARDTDARAESSDRSQQVPAATSSPSESATEVLDTCGNCGADRKGKYCHICGQRHRDGPLTFRYFGQQVVRVFFDLERGFLYTFRKMLVAPGEVARRYLDGEQRRFISPVAYYIIAVTISILVTTLFWDALIDHALTNAGRYGDVGQMDRAAEALGYDGRRAFLEGILDKFMNYTMYLNLATVFSMAAALRVYLSFRTLAEWTVVSTFSTAQGILITAVLTPVMMTINMPNVQAVLGLGVQMLLIGWVASAFGENRWRSAVLGAVSYATGFIIASLVMAALAVGVIFGIEYFNIDLGLLPDGAESATEAAPSSGTAEPTDPGP